MIQRLNDFLNKPMKNEKIHDPAWVQQVPRHRYLHGEVVAMNGLRRIRPKDKKMGGAELHRPTTNAYFEAFPQASDSLQSLKSVANTIDARQLFGLLMPAGLYRSCRSKPSNMQHAEDATD